MLKMVDGTGIIGEDLICPLGVSTPQPEQNAIRALKTYYPTTVITADGGELDPDIKVTYRKEI